MTLVVCDKKLFLYLNYHTDHFLLKKNQSVNRLQLTKTDLIFLWSGHEIEKVRT